MKLNQKIQGSVFKEFKEKEEESSLLDSSQVFLNLTLHEDHLPNPWIASIRLIYLLNVQYSFLLYTYG